MRPIFSVPRRGTVTIVNADRMVFQVDIATNETQEVAETYRVRLRNLRGPNLFLSAASSAVVSTIAGSGEVDYDADGDNLIEVETRAQLSAMRYDLGGKGLAGVDGGDAAAYGEAFPFFDVEETCTIACVGYELSDDVGPVGRGLGPDRRRGAQPVGRRRAA